MEKKTIGKFISVLRRANGMTQKELGERLFVSDKTVSRWERDECTPELSLIPSIAEIFGITVDELLRGERNTTPVTEDKDTQDRQNIKSEKQFQLMLHRNTRKFHYLAVVALGITFLGFLIAIICNSVFYRGELGFYLACSCCFASIICQICFTIHSLPLIDEDLTPSQIDTLYAFRTDVILKTVKLLFVVLAVLLFCLPLAFIGNAHFGLNAEIWFPRGLLTALIGVVCADCIYQIFIIKHLALKKIIHLDEARLEQLHANNKRLKKGCIISLSIFASLALVSYLTYDVFHFVDLELYLLILFYLNAGVSFLLYCLNKFRTKH